MKLRTFYVYILSNPTDRVLYIGVTNDLLRRAYEHREKQIDGFTKRYNVTKLVYFEEFATIEAAILREKQLKAGSRARKTTLIETINSNYTDLFDQLA